MPEYVLGRNVTVMWNIDLGAGAQYYRLFCAKSMELDIVQDEIESTTITSGTDREFEIGLQSAVLTLVGVTKTKSPPDVDVISAFTLYNKRKQKLALQVVFVDQDGNPVTFTFDAICRRLNFAGNALSFNQSTAEFRISGPLVSDAYGAGGGDCVSITGGTFAPPDATIGVFYSFSYALSGSSPYTLVSENWPDGITGHILINHYVVSGTPTNAGDVGTFAVNAVIQNACGQISPSANITVDP